MHRAFAGSYCQMRSSPLVEKKTLPRQSATPSPPRNAVLSGTWWRVASCRMPGFGQRTGCQATEASSRTCMASRVPASRLGHFFGVKR
ncbi:MAG: hypothetical protein ACKPBU_02935 [Alphaproteobacteria bacterium]